MKNCRKSKLTKPHLCSDKIYDRVLNEARYFLENCCTIRKVAKEFKVSRSCVHRDFRFVLPVINSNVYTQVSALLDKNLSERHLRGGEMTKKLYERIRQEKELAKKN